MVSQDDTSVVTFRFIRPQAREVFLAGDFNGWDPRATPMRRTKNGTWICCLELPEGVYRFKYVVDGDWYLDYASFGIEFDTFAWNSVVLVRAPLPRRSSRRTESSRRLEEPQWKQRPEIVKPSQPVGTTAP